jgi:hypothetical protein
MLKSIVVKIFVIFTVRDLPVNDKSVACRTGVCIVMSQCVDGQSHTHTHVCVVAKVTTSSPKIRAQDSFRVLAEIFLRRMSYK